MEPNDALRTTFSASLERALSDLGLGHEQIETYLTDLLVGFMHRDAVFGFRSADGRRIESLQEMLAEGDVTLRATSFDRERQVHKYVGDFLLFWGGMFPEQLKAGVREGIFDLTRQGRESYAIAASFDHPPYHTEAPLLGRLSADFEGYQLGLARVRKTLFQA